MEKVGKTLGQLGKGTAGVSFPRYERGYGQTERRDSERLRSMIDGMAAVSEDASSATDKPESTVTSGNDDESRQEAPRYYPRRRRHGVATDLTKVKAILSKVLSHRGLDKKVERYEFILHWPEIVGERIAEVSKPDCIVNRRLFVNVLHPAWAQELTMIKPVLLESLTQFLRPGDVVRDMVFRVKSFLP